MKIGLNTVVAEIYTVNYYDDYLFWGNPYGGPMGTQSATVKGLLTSTRVNTYTRPKKPKIVKKKKPNGEETTEIIYE